MKTNKFILGLLVIILIPITYVNTYANYDYVCSYKIGTCQDYEDNCWVSEGHKYCQGVRTTHTIIGNTRVGCPGGAQTSEKDSFKDTKQLGLQNVGGFMFGSKSGVWDWNVVNQNSNSQDFSTVGKLAQDFSIDKKNSEQNNTIISGDEEVSCIIDVGEISDKTDLESPEIKIKQESYSGIIFPTPLNNTCYTDQWCISKASSGSILNTPTQNEVGTYNSGLNTESCYRKYKEDNYCTRYINSADTHIGTKVTIKCDDNKSGCQNYYQVRGNDSDVESDNVGKLNDNDTFILVFDGIYDIIVPDKAGNIGIKKIEYKNGTINSLSQSEKNIERIKSVKTKIDLKSSTTLIKHKTNGPVSDFIQCYLADKVSKCDNSDTIEPEGVILFNDKKGTFNEGIYYPENKCVREIKLQAKCISDTAPVLITPSGCNGEIQETQNITSNIEGADIGIIDIVGNLKILKYNINTIDLISPTFSNATPEILRVTGEDENIGSKRTLHFTILEESAIGCYTTNKVKYLVNFSIKPKGSTEKINKTLTGEIDASSSKGIKTKIQHDFDFKQVGEYTIESIILTDSAGNIGTLNPNYLFNVYPGNFDFKNSSLELKGIETTEMGQNDVYANFKDKYTYILTLKDASGNPIYGKKVSELIQDVEDNKKIKTKISEGQYAIDISLEGTGLTNNNGQIKIFVKSLAPGEFISKFKFKLPKWDLKYENNDNQYITINHKDEKKFLKPIVANLKVVDGELSIGTYEKVVLSGSNLGDIPSTDIYFSNLDTVYLSGSNGEFSFETGSFNSENLLSSINIRINVLKSKLTGKEKISLNFTKTPIVKYILEGKEISYFLSENDDWYFNNTDIEFTNIKFRGLETTGKTQAKGKQTVGNNDIMQNFSDLSLSNPRSLIRQNGYKITKGMKNGQVVKGIKYVEGDVYISGDPSLGLEPYETLVVKDGNVIIEDNLNTSGKKLGIIVLKDGYDINKDFKNKGNIYIEPNVTYIHAALYADGGLISANTDGEPFIEDSVERTETLNKQLVIKGFLFTRNTIGGAFAYGGDYILPGGSKTTDFDMALIYDINLLRRNNDGYPSIYNKTKDGNVVTLYDALLQTDCPKGFNY